MTDPVWTLRAECDLQHYYQSEEEYAEGRGIDLLNAVQAGDELLAKNPFAGPIYEPPFRRLVLSNPRFGVFYIPEDRGVIIHALCNLAQPRENIIHHLRM